MTGQVLKINSTSLKEEQYSDERNLAHASQSDLHAEAAPDTETIPEEIGVKDKYHAIEAALREVAYQLDNENPQLPDAVAEFRADFPEDDSVKREYARLSTEHAKRSKKVESPGDFQSLQDEMRGLRDRLSEESDDFKRSVEDHLSSSNSVLQNLCDRLEKLEQDSHENRHTLDAILRNLSEQAEADRARNDRVWKDLSSSLVSVKMNLSNFEKQSDDTHGKLNAKSKALSASFDNLSNNLVTIRNQMRQLGGAFEDSLSALNSNITQELEASEQRVGERFEKRFIEAEALRGEKENALDAALKALRDRLDKDCAQSEAELSQVHKSLSTIMQELEASEKRVQEFVDVRLEKANQAKNTEERSVRQRFERLTEELKADKNRSKAALSKVQVSLSQIAQDSTDLEDRVRRELHDRFEQVEQSCNERERSISAALEDLVGKVSVERARGDRFISELRSLRQTAQGKPGLEETVRTTLQEHLERAETSQKKTERLQRESLAAVADEIESERSRLDVVISKVQALGNVAKEQDGCFEARVREIIESYLIRQGNKARLSKTQSIDILRSMIDSISPN